MFLDALHCACLSPLPGFPAAGAQGAGVVYVLPEGADAELASTAAVPDPAAQGSVQPPQAQARYRHCRIPNLSVRLGILHNNRQSLGSSRPDDS